MNRTCAQFELDIVASSFGGVATTTFIDYLGKRVVVNCPGNTDGLKHAAKPPYSCNPYFRGIYIFGDPALATISLFKRNFASWHSGIMQENFGENDLIPDDLSLESYLNEGRDRFHFRKHFDTWVNTACWYPRLIIRYDVIWDRLDDIAEFLHLPRSTFADFPPKKTRGSSLDGISATARNKLDVLYGEDQQYFEQQPEYRLLPGQKAHYLSDLRQLPKSRPRLRTVARSLQRNIKVRGAT